VTHEQDACHLCFLPGDRESLYFVMRVMLVGLWVTLGAPWLFRRLRLASAE
jgi:hypothetical protein